MALPPWSLWPWPFHHGRYGRHPLPTHALSRPPGPYDGCHGNIGAMHTMHIFQSSLHIRTWRTENSLDVSLHIQSYLLRFGVFWVYLWGPNTEPQQVALDVLYVCLYPQTQLESVVFSQIRHFRGFCYFTVRGSDKHIGNDPAQVVRRCEKYIVEITLPTTTWMSQEVRKWLASGL